MDGGVAGEGVMQSVAPMVQGVENGKSNPHHPPRFLTIGRVECLRIDELRNLVGLTHAYAPAG